MVSNQNPAPKQSLKDRPQLIEHRHLYFIYVPLLEVRHKNPVGANRLYHEITQGIPVPGTVKMSQDKTGHIVIHQEGPMAQIGHATV